MSDNAVARIDRELRAAEGARYAHDIEDIKVRLRILRRGIAALVDGIEDEEPAGLIDVCDELKVAAGKVDDLARQLNFKRVMLDQVRGEQRKRGELR